MPERLKKAAFLAAPFLVCSLHTGCNNPDIESKDELIRNTRNSASSSTLTKPQKAKYVLTYMNRTTTGILEKPNGEFYLPESNTTTNPDLKFNKVEILNPTGRDRFLTKTPKGLLEIPLDNVEIQGELSWASKNLRLPWLGFDCAQPELIKRIPEIGAASVRIPVEQADKDFFQKRPEVIEAINAAKLNRLKIMLLFNPTELLSTEETEKRIDSILGILDGYQNVTFELGNEPDLEWFWKDADLDSFAKFVNRTSQILAQKSPHSEQIIGGIAQHDAIRPFLQALRRNGVDPNQFSIGVHAYNSTKEVEDKIQTLKSELHPNTKLVFTEIGWNKSQVDKGKHIVSMIEAGKAMGVEEYYIFQLRNIPFAGTDDKGLWGYVDPSGKWEKQVWSLVDYIWKKATKN